MTNQRKKLFILASLLIVSTLFTQLFAQKTFIVGPSDVEDFIDHLFCEYGSEIGISEDAVEDFFKSINDPRYKVDNLCPTPDVGVVGSTPTSMIFDWADIPQAGGGYTHGDLNLDDGRTSVTKSPLSQAAYTGLDPNLYLFAFVSHCSQLKASKAYIIIAEKDIFFHQTQNPSFNFGCYCDGNPISLPGNSCGSLGTANSYSFPYVNSCPANKFWVSVKGQLGDEFYSSNVYFIHHETEEIDRLMVLSYCTPGGNPGRWQSFGDLENYVVVFSNEKVHVYIENPNLIVNSVTAFRCGCYYPGDDDIIIIDTPPADSKARNAEVEESFSPEFQLQASPNPFTDELWVKIDSPYDNSAQILLFDHSGRMITRVPHQDLSRGEQQLQIQTADLAPGLYHVQLRTDQGVLTQKVLKL